MNTDNDILTFVWAITQLISSVACNVVLEDAASQPGDKTFDYDSTIAGSGYEIATGWNDNIFTASAACGEPTDCRIW